jgi:hypothetical protein
VGTRSRKVLTADEPSEEPGGIEKHATGKLVGRTEEEKRDGCLLHLRVA